MIHVDGEIRPEHQWGPTRAGWILVVCLATTVTASTAGPDGQAGGSQRLAHQHLPDFTQQERDDLAQRIQLSRQALVDSGALSSAASVATPLFLWPVRAAPWVTDYAVDAIGAYVDQDPDNPGQVLDYYCGSRSYDFAGYNHLGTDIFTFPFAWKKMDQDAAQVVAAAAGTLLLKQDGHYDRNCSLGSQPWNGVVIEHADGSTAWYAHFKSGTVTAKGVGASVAAGEYLGIVGSSGSSGAPHLHLEVRDSLDNLIDPFAGPCNGFNFESWWASQPDYHVSRVNALMTGNDFPEVYAPTCGTAEVTHEQTTFLRASTVYFTIMYRDLLAGQLSELSILRPDGSTWADWDHSDATEFQPSAWWSWYFFDVANGGPDGVWSFRAIHQSQSYQRDFYVVQACPDSASLPAQTITADRTEAAVNDLGVQLGVSVQGGTQLTLLAGGSLAISGPFSVAAGSSLRAIVSPDICAF